jgi:hypothetical protein
MGKKLFNFVIGNPPYQDMTDSDSTRMPPIYDKFMDAADEVADKVELIHPARFLFNAGYTPKSWNEKMLNNKHFKVLMYEPDSDKVFPNLSTPLKGGVAVTYYDHNADFGVIGIFTKFPELNSILNKVQKTQPESIEDIISSPLSYKVSDLMIKENPDLVPRLRSSAFTKLARIIYSQKPDDGKEYVGLIGLDENKKRTKRYIRKDYIVDSGGTLDKFTLLMAKANGSGDFGETLSAASIAEPGVGYLQTFIGIGKFDSIEEARNAEKYIKTKFARAMLGILKTTQDCPGPKWHYIPLQDFTTSSDIDWSKSIHEIDLQLYRKYGLDEKEIAFIESHVKEMA